MTQAEILRIIRVLASTEGYLCGLGAPTPAWLVAELDEAIRILEQEIIQS